MMFSGIFAKKMENLIVSNLFKKRTNFSKVVKWEIKYAPWFGDYSKNYANEIYNYEEINVVN